MTSATPTTCETTIELGTIKGFEFTDLKVKQYYGIPYATVPGRFRLSELNSNWINGAHDGTKLGPDMAQHFDGDIIAEPDRSWIEKPLLDEFKLTLNITVPEIEEGQKVPVMVFIYGGGNTFGSANSLFYDGHRMAGKSNEMGKPTINVVLQYRLGALGYLSSSDLVKYCEKHGNHGVGNYGASDHHNALLWVKENIKYFGGDASKITLFGESAGSINTHIAVMNDKEGLIHRAVLHSGLAPLCSIYTLKEYDVIYSKILDRLGIKGETWEERVDALVKVDVDKLIDVVDDLTVLPKGMTAQTEGKYSKAVIPTYKDLGSKIPSTIDAVMIGNCVHEAIIYASSFSQFTGKEFIEHAKTISDNAELYLKLYGIKEEFNKQQNTMAVEMMCTDGIFLIPNYLFYESNDGYLFHFDEPSTLGGPLNGLSHHALDIVYLWGSLSDTLGPEQRKVMDVMMKYWILFANGEEPWEIYLKNHKAMVFGNGQPSKLIEEEKDDKRLARIKIWKELIEKDLVEDFCKFCEEVGLQRSKDHGNPN